MKVQCELCREIVPIGDFEASSEGIRIECRACGGRFFVPAPGKGSGEGEGAEDGCPKCGAGVGDGVEACPSCGLKVALFEEFVRRREEEDEAVSPELRALWEDCEASWAHRETHDRFLEAASACGAFAFAARRYRAALRRRRADPVAADRLARISKMAEAALLTGAAAARRSEDDERQPYRMVVALLVVLVLLAGAGAAYFMVRVAEASGWR